ncbi:MAG: dihydrodipicolinate synthase family protein [Planctomycetota bacterium]
MLVTALVTPFTKGGMAPDLACYARLVRFQLDHGTDQVLVAGTTGEATALSEAERHALLDAALEQARPEQIMLAIGPGALPEVIARGRRALQLGVRDLLLVDAPYSGASSAALRESWHGAVAAALPEARLFPYAVPARTGTELLPDDLARLVEEHPNVVGVKDATGRLARMERVRALCGEDFLLLCGDDALLRDAMIDPHIRAHGGCTVTSNLAPTAMRALHDAAAALQAARARELHDSLQPLFELMGVTAEEQILLRGDVVKVPQRSKNPVPVKAALGLLSVMSGDVRAPLAAMGPASLARVREVLRLVERRQPSPLSALRAAFTPVTALETAAG